MAETISEIRKRSWKTRREKYGVRGHSGTYGYPDTFENKGGVWRYYQVRDNGKICSGTTRLGNDWASAASRLRAEDAPVEAKPTSSPLGRQEEHPSGYDNPLTMDRILQLAHVLCKCPPEYRSSWSCDPCRAFAELIFFRQSAATPVSVGGEDKKKNSNSSVK